MGDPFIISGLREKRSATAGRIVELRREVDRLQADPFHIDAVLRLYEVEPADIPTKRACRCARPTSAARRSPGASTTRCASVDVSAVDIAAQAMRDKGLELAADRKQRVAFSRFLTSLHDLRKAGRWRQGGAVEIGLGWATAIVSPFDCDCATPSLPWHTLGRPLSGRLARVGQRAVLLRLERNTSVRLIAMTGAFIATDDVEPVGKALSRANWSALMTRIRSKLLSGAARVSKSKSS